MAGVNSCFASISEVEILKIQEDAVPENTKKATKNVVRSLSEYILEQFFFSISVSSGRIFTSPLRYSPRFQRIIIVNCAWLI